MFNVLTNKHVLGEMCVLGRKIGEQSLSFFNDIGLLSGSPNIISIFELLLLL